MDDLDPPIITEVKSETTIYPGKDSTIQTLISWVTNKDSSSILLYKEGVQKDSEVDQKIKNQDFTSLTNDGWKIIKKDSLSKNHLFVVTDFRSSSIYQFKAISEDKYTNLDISKNYTFLTPTKAQSIFDIIIKNFEDTFGWTKNMGK